MIFYVKRIFNFNILIERKKISLKVISKLGLEIKLEYFPRTVPVSHTHASSLSYTPKQVRHAKYLKRDRSLACRWSIEARHAGSRSSSSVQVSLGA